jgi:hypothetical protein
MAIIERIIAQLEAQGGESFAASMANAARSIRDTGDAAENVTDETDTLARSQQVLERAMQNSARSANVLQRQQEQLISVMSSARSAARSLYDSQEDLARISQRVESAQQALERAIDETGDSSVRSRIAANEYEAALSHLASATTRAASSQQNLESANQSLEQSEQALENAVSATERALDRQANRTNFVIGALRTLGNAADAAQNAMKGLGRGLEGVADHVSELGRNGTGASGALRLVDNAAEKARNSLLGLRGASELAGKGLDKLRNDAFGAVAAMQMLGAAALKTDTKLALLGLALPAATLVGMAGGAATVTASILAAGAAATYATTAFLGLGVFKNIQEEGGELASTIKDLEGQMKKLEKAGKTGTAEYQKLSQQLAETRAEFDQTALGMIQSVQKFVTKTAQVVSLPIFDALKKNLQKTVDALDDPKVIAASDKLAWSVESAVARIGKALGPDFYRPADAIAKIFGIMETHIDRVSTAIADNMPLIKAMAENFKLFGQFLGGPTLIALKAFYSSLQSINPASADFAAKTEKARQAMQLLGNMFAIGGVAVTNFASGLIRGLSPAFSKLNESLQNTITRGGGLAKFLDNVDAIAQRVGVAVGNLVGGFIQFVVAIGAAGAKLGIWEGLLNFFEKAVQKVGDFFAWAGQKINDFAAQVKAGDQMATFIFNFANAFEVLTIAFVVAAPIITKVTSLLGLLANPFGLLIIAVTGLFAAWNSNFMGMKDVLQPVVDTLSVAFTYLQNRFTDIVGAIMPMMQAMEAVRQIANPTASGFDLISQRLDILHTAVGVAAQKLAAEFAVMLGRVIDLASQFAPKLLDMAYTWGVSLVEWVAPVAGYLIEKLAGLITSVLNWIAGQAPVILTQLASWGIAFVEWSAPIVGGLIGRLAAVVMSILSWIGANTGLIISKLTEWSVAFVQWIVPLAAQILQRLGQVISQIGSAIIAAAPQIGAAASQWAIAIIQGFGGNIRGLQPILEGIRVSVMAVVTVFGNIVKALGPVMPVIGALAIGFIGLKVAMIALGPVIALVSGVGTALIGMFTSLGAVLLKATAAFLSVGGGMSGLGAALGVLISPMGVLIALAAAFAVAFITNFAGVRDATMKVVSAFQANFQPVLQNVGSFITGTVIPAITGLVQWLGSTLQPVVAAAGNVISNNIIPAFASFANAAINVGKFIFEVAKVIGAILAPIVQGLAGIFSGVLLPILGAVFSAFGFLMDVIGKVAGFISANVLPAVQGLADFLGGVLGTVINTIVQTLSRFVGVLGGVVEAIGKVFTGDFVGAGQSLGKAFDTASGKAVEAKAAFEATTTSVDKATNHFEEGSRRIATTNDNAGKSFLDLTKSSQDTGMAALNFGGQVGDLTTNMFNNETATRRAADATSLFGEKAAGAGGPTKTLADEIDRLEKAQNKASSEASKAQQGMSNLEGAILRLNPAVKEQWEGYKKSYEEAHKAGFANAELNARLSEQEGRMRENNPKIAEYGEAWKIAYDSQYKSQKAADDNTASIWLNQSALQQQQSAFTNAQASILGTSQAYQDSSTAGGAFTNSLVLLNQTAAVEFAKLPTTAQEKMAETGMAIMKESQAFVPLSQGEFAKLSPAVQQELMKLAPMTQQELANLPPTAQLEFARMGQAMISQTGASVPLLQSTLAQLSPIAQSEFAKMPVTAQAELSKMGPITTSTLSQLSPTAQAEFAKLSPVAQAELGKLQPITQQQLSKLAPMTKEEFSKLPPAAQAEMVQLGIAASAEAGKVVPLTKAQLDKLPPEVRAVFDKTANEAKTGSSQFVQEAQEGMGRVAPAVETQLKQVPEKAKTALDQTATQAQGSLQKTEDVAQKGASETVTAIQNEFMKTHLLTQVAFALFNASVLAQVGITRQNGTQIGIALGQGMVQGIYAQAGSVAAAAAQIASTAAAAAKANLQIASPSRIFLKIGEQTVEGLVLGIENGEGEVGGAMDKITFQMSEKAMEAAQKQADTLSKVADATSKIVDSLNKVRGYVSVGKGPLMAFSSDMLALATEFAETGKVFSKKALEAASEFADAAGKVADTVGKMADSLNKLRDYTPISQKAISSFIANIEWLMLDFVLMAANFNKKMLEAASQFSDVANKVADTVGKAADALSKIRGWQGPMRQSITDFVQQLRDLVLDFAGAMTTYFKPEMLQAATTFSETSMKVSEAVTKGAEALQAIKNWQGPLRQSIIDFVQQLRDLTLDFADAMTKYFTPEMTKAAVSFADTSIKVSDATLKGAEALSKLKDWQGPLRQSITDFVQQLRDLTLEFSWAMQKYFSQEMLASAEMFANSSQLVSDATLKGVDALIKLKDYSGPTRDVISQFTQDLKQLTLEFVSASQRFTVETLKSATEFAMTAGIVADTVEKGVDALLKLAEYSGVNKQNVLLFSADLQLVISLFSEVSSKFSIEMMTKATEFANAAGPVVDTISKAVDGFKGLRTYSKTPETAIRNLISDLELAVKLTGEATKKVQSEMLEQVGKFGDAVGKLFSGFKTAMELFEGLQEYKSVPPTVIQNFIDSLKFTVGLATAMVQQTDKELLGKVTAFGEAVGKIFSGFKSAMDLFKSLEDYKAVPVQVIEGFINQIVYTVNLAGNLASTTNTELVDRAQSFLEGSSNVFTALKEAVDKFGVLSEIKAKPREALQGVLDEITVALRLMSEAADKAREIMEKAEKYRHDMGEAANKVKEGNDKAGEAKPNPSGDSGGSSSSNSQGAPAYGEGVLSHPGGPAFIAERGLPELVKFPNDNGYFLASGPLFMNLPRGTRVYDPTETKGFLDMSSNINQAAEGFYNNVFTKDNGLATIEAAIGSIASGNSNTNTGGMVTAMAEPSSIFTSKAASGGNRFNQSNDNRRSSNVSYIDSDVNINVQQMQDAADIALSYSRIAGRTMTNG